MAKPYREGAGWSVRVRSENIDLSGFKTSGAAKKAMDDRRKGREV